MSENLGNKTVLSGLVSKGKNDLSQSLQMMQRPLMTTDELKSMPKGNFILMKTGKNPMKTTLKLFIHWKIKFDKESYEVNARSQRDVEYADISQIERSIKSQTDYQNIEINLKDSIKKARKSGIKIE